MFASLKKEKKSKRFCDSILASQQWIVVEGERSEQAFLFYDSVMEDGRMNELLLA